MNSMVITLLIFSAVIFVSGCTSSQSGGTYEEAYQPTTSQSGSEPSSIMGPKSGIPLQEIYILGEATDEYLFEFTEHTAYIAPNGDIHVVGKIVNNANQNIKLMGVLTTFYDESGDLLPIGPATGSTNIIDGLNVGETKIFEAVMPKSSKKVARYYIDVDTDIFIPGSKINIPKQELPEELPEFPLLPLKSFLYDDFSSGNLDNSKWVLDDEDPNNDYFTTEALINTAEAAFHIEQKETKDSSVLLVMSRNIKSGEVLEFDVNYKSGSGNNLIFYRIDRNGIQNLIGCSNCGTIGFWNSGGSIGTALGLYHFTLQFGDSDLFITVIIPDGTEWKKTVSIASLSSPYEFRIGAGTGHNGLIHVDFDNFVIYSDL